MKVVVCFGSTRVVVPCGNGAIRVQELVGEAVTRYRKAAGKEAGYPVVVHHLEHGDGGILDPDDRLGDICDDKDKLVAVFEEGDGSVTGPSLTVGARPSARTRPGVSLLSAVLPRPWEPRPASAFYPYQSLSEMNVTATALGLAPRSLAGAGGSRDGNQTSGRVRSANSSPKLICAASATGYGEYCTTERGSADEGSSSLSEMVRTITVETGSEPLGMHIVHFGSRAKRNLGLHVRSLSKDSRAEREGWFDAGDCIVCVNDISLLDNTFEQSQQVFVNAMRAGPMVLQVVPASKLAHYRASLPPHLGFGRRSPGRSASPPTQRSLCEFDETRLRSTSEPTSPQQSSSPTMQSLPGPRKPGTPLALGPGTRSFRKRMSLRLHKGSDGLGFTIATKDGPIGEQNPVYIKNVLPRGAAIVDGRMRPGDLLLKVNDEEVVGKSQEEVVSCLRAIPAGGVVSLTLCRQEDVFLPRQLKGEDEVKTATGVHKQLMTFEVTLNDSGSAGLGISVKGSREEGKDLGIFVKSIIRGGAAFKDGRLQVNDQLVAVNGQSLLEKTNFDAMETLRHSMSTDGNLRGMIQIVVARRGGSYPQQTASPPSPLRGSDHVAAMTELFQMNFLHHWRQDSGIMGYQGTGKPSRSHALSDDDVPPPLPPRPPLTGLGHAGSTPLHRLDSWRSQVASVGALGRDSERSQIGGHDVLSGRKSRSMDLLMEDEDDEEEESKYIPGLQAWAYGPALGLKMSSSLESLQAALSGSTNDGTASGQLPRSRAALSRGCNDSFRAAIDKSYERRPVMEEETAVSEEADEDATESVQSGQEERSAHNGADRLPSSFGLPVGKAKKKEKKGKKEKERKEGRLRSFGVMFRFGKSKKGDKVAKGDRRDSRKQEPQNTALTEEEIEKMKEEQKRIQAKHAELRECQPMVSGPTPALPEMEDDEFDPAYARVSCFLPEPTQQPAGPIPMPGGDDGSPEPGYERVWADEPGGEPVEHRAEQQCNPKDDFDIDSLYAKVDKNRHSTRPESFSLAPTSKDRVHQLREEFQRRGREDIQQTNEPPLPEKQRPPMESWSDHSLAQVETPRQLEQFGSIAATRKCNTLPWPLKKPCRGAANESRVWNDHRVVTKDPGADPPFNGNSETGSGPLVKESIPQNDLETARHPGNEPTHTCNGLRRPQSEAGMRPPIRLDVPPPGVESAYRVCVKPDFGATRPTTERHSQQRY
uniref:partitioning defective 3 homolog B isoform X2 n=1 Tax=Myxine glutinosa TaxID=7769 RepID=UPI00358F1C74